MLYDFIMNSTKNKNKIENLGRESEQCVLKITASSLPLSPSPSPLLSSLLSPLSSLSESPSISSPL
jgi:hypothetical protein